MEKYKYFVTSIFGSKEVFPQNGNTFAVNYEKPDERAFFTKKFKGVFLFKQEDFHWFYKLETSSYRCQGASLLIKKDCNGQYLDFYSLEINLNNGKNWDLDECILNIEGTDSDRYTCYESKKDVDYNILFNVPSEQVVNLIQGEIETQFCDGYGQTPPPFCGTDAESNGWTIFEFAAYDPTIESGNVSFIYRIQYVREKITSLTPLPDPWISIGGNVYVKKPALYNRVDYTNRNGDGSIILSYGYYYTYGGIIDNGMKLKDVFEYFVSTLCPGYTLKSDFFQWNPDNVSTINYATNQPSKVLNLILFQTSDVKRPNVSGDATKAEISFEDLLKDICNMFQLKWDIDSNNRFVIEHVSFFVKGVGMNLITRYDAKKRIGKRKYSYDNDRMPKIETFKMATFKAQTGDFKGYPIEYSGSCVGQGDLKEKEYLVENIQTNVQLCFDNPSADSKIISDEGFVLIACDSGNGIITQTAIQPGSNTLNNSLSWAYLHEDYWRYNRVLKTFKMNNAIQTALSTIPTKKGVQLDVSLCCGEDFDPETKTITELGIGFTSEASFLLYSELLQITLLYDAEDGINVSEPPTANNDSAQLFHDTMIDIDVAANDTDLGGSLDLNSIQIVTTPSHGIAVPLGNGKVRYIPTAGYIGNDSFTYLIRDNDGNPSNIATVEITVTDGAPIPIAVDDAFTVAKNANIILANLLTNDTAVAPKTVLAGTKATTQGGTVQIYGDGRFLYTAPTDYIGTDSFDYTLIDGNSTTDTATVTITIVDKQAVYVKYEELDPESEYILAQCGSVFNAIVGTRKTITRKYSFFSDAAGTVPLNVKGYGLILKSKVTVDENSGLNETLFDIDVDANSIEPEVYSIEFTKDEVEYNNYGCDSTTGYEYHNRSYELLSSPNYIIL